MIPMRASVVALPAFLLMAPAVRAEPRPAWEVDAVGTAQYNPGADAERAARFGAGFAVRLLRAVGTNGQLGLHVEAIWLIPDDETREFDAQQQDALFMGRLRIVNRPTWALHGQAGVGVSRYQGMVDIPETPGCFGCGRYGDTTYRPALQAGVNADVALGRDLFLSAGVRAALVLIRAEVTDVHNFLPPSLALRVDLGLAMRF